MAKKTIKYHDTHFDLSYEILCATQTPPSLSAILFLHGWGSNKEIMKIAFAQTFQQYHHIYLDMPGFGNSPNETSLYTQDYAHIVKLFLEQIDYKVELIVGHSFGGKVGILCAPKEMILLSSAGIKIAKSFKVRCKICLAKLLGQFGLKGITKRFRSQDVKEMNEGMYQTFKNVVDEDFSDQFVAYKGKASIFWGKSDTATPLFCGYKIANLIEDSQFFALEGDHYFFLKQGEKIQKLYEGGEENG